MKLRKQKKKSAVLWWALPNNCQILLTTAANPVVNATAYKLILTGLKLKPITWPFMAVE